jgi:hypothetical protein
MTRVTNAVRWSVLYPARHLPPPRFREWDRRLDEPPLVVSQVIGGSEAICVRQDGARRYIEHTAPDKGSHVSKTYLSRATVV